MVEQFTSSDTCKQKRTYHSYDTGKRAAKRRNKAAGYHYLRAYKCNICELWHVTTQDKLAQPPITKEQGKTVE